MNDCQPGGPGRALPWFSTWPAKAWVTALGLSLGLTALGGCGQGDLCQTTYGDICVPNPNHVATPPPRPLFGPNSVAVVPAATPGLLPTTGGPSQGAPIQAAVPLGDPSTFADVDDKQCRSYGLTFGSHDYADCRIRLSAQHRGLDPSIGAAPAGRANP